MNRIYYIDIGLLEICVEGEHDEDWVALQGDDDEEEEEYHEVDRFMQHCPEAQPGEPAWDVVNICWVSQVLLTESYNQTDDGQNVEHFPDKDPDLLV